MSETFETGAGGLAAIVGQARATAALRAMLRTGRVPGAVLFHGRAGVGKFRTAIAFARALLCEAGGDDACGACRSCRRSERRTHPNLRVVAEGTGVRSIKIDEIRALQAELGLKPMEGRRKVVVVDNADRLLPASANALLKTLEEPPPDACLVLVAASLDRVLETIRSRCHHLRFRPLAPDDARRVLEGHEGCPDGGADLLARFAGGSPGRAIELASFGFASEPDALVELLLGLGDRRADPLEAAEELRARAVGGEKVDRARARVLVEEALGFLAAFAGDVLRSLAGEAPGRSAFSRRSVEAAVTRHGGAPETWEFVLRGCLEAAHNVRLNADVDLAVGDLFLAIDRRWGGGAAA